MEEHIDIRFLDKQEIPKALDLAWEVFQKYVAIDYVQEGIDEFYTFLHSPLLTQPLVYYGAFDQNQIIGMIAMRKNHIALFFVKDTYQHQGIGKALFTYMLTQIPDQVISVNASPYATEIYRELGFHSHASMKEEHGIRYLPMFYNR